MRAHAYTLQLIQIRSENNTNNKISNKKQNIGCRTEKTNFKMPVW